METKPPRNQLIAVTGVSSTILSCGLGLGFFTTILKTIRTQNEEDTAFSYIETAGEIAFTLSVIVIPLLMHVKGRRIANLATTIPLLISWIISLNPTNNIYLTIANILHNVSVGGTVTISSISISEYSSPKCRATFLMLETVMLSFGLLISHIFAAYSFWSVVSFFGFLSAFISLSVAYLTPESPYWLIHRGYIEKCTESFYWLRDRSEDSKEIETLIQIYSVKIQRESLRPIRRSGISEIILDYLKSLLTADFLKPLFIVILLFSFVSFGSNNFAKNYLFRNYFELSDGFTGTIIFDVLTLVCSITACVLIQIVKRKTLFLFTGAVSILFLGFICIFMFLETTLMFSPNYSWLLLCFVTGFIMFMSLGTAALPFALIGEIFTMSHKSIGSFLSFAYLWVFFNSLSKLIPIGSEQIGVPGVLFIATITMTSIIIVVNKIMPETCTETLMDIEVLLKLSKNDNESYIAVDVNEQNVTGNSFDKLKLFIES